MTSGRRMRWRRRNMTTENGVSWRKRWATGRWWGWKKRKRNWQYQTVHKAIYEKDSRARRGRYLKGIKRMSVTVRWWDEAKKNIILYKFEGKWTWDEFYPAYYESIEMMDSVDYKTNFIMDLL